MNIFAFGSSNFAFIYQSLSDITDRRPTMDNIKNFIGNVMTTTNAAATTSGGGGNKYTTTATSETQKASSRSAGVAATQTYPKYVAKATLADDGSTYLAALASVAGLPRNRTVSESSVDSDVSVGDLTATDLNARRQQLKRKDSEPYFWIM